jgi:hypothetical protein
LALGLGHDAERQKPFRHYFEAFLVVDRSICVNLLSSAVSRCAIGVHSSIGGSFCALLRPFLGRVLTFAPLREILSARLGALIAQ